MDRWRIRRGKKRQGFYSHMPASEIKALLPPDIWAGYFKFCFVRNPWERVVSYWHHRQAIGDDRGLDQLIRAGKLDRLRRTGIGCYAIGESLAVDHLCRYENLEQELRFLEAKLGLPARLTLPRAKGGFRKDRRHYQETLSPAQQQYVRDLFADEIALVGY